MTTLTLFWGQHSLVYVVRDWEFMIHILKELPQVPLCSRVKVQDAIVVDAIVVDAIRIKDLQSAIV